MNLAEIKKLNISITPGSYQLYSKKGQIIYIGKAANLKSRVLSYWQKSTNHTPAKYSMLKQIVKIKWVETDSEIEALLLESNLVKKYQPYYNVLLRDDKRFSYIKISLEDEIPGVFLTRTVDKSGKYFGPFVSAQAARETIKTIRKIWPYCNMKKARTRPCFYYQIGRCLGICAGKITKDEYLKQVIKPIILFLQGKKKNIIKKLEVRIKKLEKSIKHQASSIKYNEKKKKNSDKLNTKYIIRDTLYKKNLDEISLLKFQLKNINQVLESTRVISVGEKYANDVVELAKTLGLPKIPERIEGYDIANIFGKEATGSMIVFSGGEANKNEYRKFKIRLGQGQANDVGMLKEVLERRLRHSVILERSLSEAIESRGRCASNEILSASGLQDDKQIWPLPDLIIVDGGKAQLNVAVRILKKHQLAIPAVAISKGAGLRSSIAPDKLFFPGEAKPLELPLASPALHLIKRVRDEAHRFAIGYHRELRSKTKFI